MSFKLWSSAQSAKAEEKPEDKAKDAPAVDQLAAEPEKKPAETVPAPKS